MCAEDDPALGDALRHVFSSLGYEVEHATNGLDAWERMAADIDHFEVLITDSNMPGLSGLELVELLREANYRGRIVVHSGSLTTSELEGFRAFKVDRFVTKAAESGQLLSVVEGLSKR